MIMLYQSGSLLGIFYYCMIVIIGNYFILNLLLAVIIDSFQKKEENKEQVKKIINFEKEISEKIDDVHIDLNVSI